MERPDPDTKTTRGVTVKLESPTNSIFRCELGVYNIHTNPFSVHNDPITSVYLA